MHDRAQFWSPVPDWPNVALRADGIDIAMVNVASVCLVSGSATQFLARNNVGEVHGPRQICDSACYALRLSPDRLLFVSEVHAVEVSGEIAPGCAITDISDGMLIFDIHGDAATELMAHGSEYPLESAIVLPLESASMQFAGFRLVVSRRALGWRLHIERPWAPALWRWLQAHAEAAKL